MKIETLRELEIGSSRAARRRRRRRKDNDDEEEEEEELFSLVVYKIANTELAHDAHTVSPLAPAASGKSVPNRIIGFFYGQLPTITLNEAIFIIRS